MLEKAQGRLDGVSTGRGGEGRGRVLTSRVPPLTPALALSVLGEWREGRERAYLISWTAKTRSATGQSSCSRTKRTTEYADKSAGADSTPHCGII